MPILRPPDYITWSTGTRERETMQSLTLSGFLVGEVGELPAGDTGFLQQASALIPHSKQERRLGRAGPAIISCMIHARKH